METHKKVLWVSRYAPPVRAQIRALQQMFGWDVEIDREDIRNATDIRDRFERYGYHDLVMVTPLATIDHLCREGLRPLYARMVTTAPRPRQKPDLAFRRQEYWFAGFQRVEDVWLDLRPVTPIRRRHVLRFTENPLRDAERSEIMRLLGEPKISDDVESFRDGDDLLARYRASGADDLLVVASHSVLDQLAERRVFPLVAEFSEGEFQALRRCYGLEMRFIELTDSPVQP